MASKLPTVAIVGQANVGKSSLFNRMVRAQQAIVAREAGTTRDNVLGRVEYRHHQFWLVDTAGLKDPNDEFEASIQEQITEAAEAADVILVVVDGTQYPSDHDRQVAKKALRSKKPTVLLVNKSDLSGSLPNDEFKRLGISTIIRTSAEHNRGIASALDAVIEHIPARSEEEPDDVLRIALIGRPNVGKSNLFNTLAGKQQALVANIAGTTRDVNRITVKYNNRSIEILDTAGVRRQGKQEVGIEKFSVLRTLQAIEEADVCMLLLDVNELNTQLDQRLAGIIDESGKGLVLVVSKWDSVIDKDAYTRDALAPRIAHAFEFVPWAPLIFTSSVTGQNVTKLLTLHSISKLADTIRPRPVYSTISSRPPSRSTHLQGSKIHTLNFAISSRQTITRHGLLFMGQILNLFTGATSATSNDSSVKPIIIQVRRSNLASSTRNKSRAIKSESSRARHRLLKPTKKPKSKKNNPNLVAI